MILNGHFMDSQYENLMDSSCRFDGIFSLIHEGFDPQLREETVSFPPKDLLTELHHIRKKNVLLNLDEVSVCGKYFFI